MARSKKTREALMHLDELFHQPFPVGLLAHELSRHLGLLQVLCFKDNEYGAAARVPETLDRVVLRPVRKRLFRARKSVELVSLTPLEDQYHQMVATFKVPGIDQDTFTFSLFQVSRRKRAAARAKSSESMGLSKPRRGAARPSKRKRKKTK